MFESIDTSILFHQKQKGVRTLAVGIGSGINYDELLEIAMDNPHYVVKVDKFEHLKNKLDIILEDSCQGKLSIHCAGRMFLCSVLCALPHKTITFEDDM